MKAVILAAGYATRLYPLTKNKPKCLLPVAGRTILDSLCSKLAKIKALEEIILVTNAKFFNQLSEWQKKADFGVPVRTLNDGTTSNETRLGAIGDLDFSIKQGKVDTDIVMLASDNLFDAGLDSFVEFAQKKKDKICIALYDIKEPKLAAKRYGVLDMDATGLIQSIEEKPEFPKSSYIGMGLYYFPKSSLNLIQKYLGGSKANDAPGFYIRWLVDNKVGIYGFLFNGIWYDIGDLKALEEANKNFKG